MVNKKKYTLHIFLAQIKSALKVNGCTPIQYSAEEVITIEARTGLRFVQ